ncbi:MAG: acyl carrier protein [Methylomonas sp.]
MCGRLGENEVKSMQNLMALTVYALIAEVFDMDMDEISPNSDLRNDLGMTAFCQERLDAKIKGMFDNFQVDFNKATTVRDIVNQVVESKMMNEMKAQPE